MESRQTPSPDDILAQLERILVSAPFANSHRSQRFLRYVVESSLNHEDHSLKEYTIAVEVFDRQPSYDSSIDATVRVEAGRLRSRLRDYYREADPNDRVVIEIPKGAYHARFTAVNQAASTTSDSAIDHTKADRHKNLLRRFPISITLAVIGLVICVSLFVAWRFVPQPIPVVDSIAQLTGDPEPKSNLVTDGSRVYFNEGLLGSSRIAQVSLEEERSVPMETPLVDPIILGAARDGSALLSVTNSMVTNSGALWSIPLPAGAPRRVGNVAVQSADMLPDNRIVYAVGKEVLIAENDGSRPKSLASLAGVVAKTMVSPDGGRILLQVDSVGDLSDTFEMTADGTGLQQIRKAAANECCFGWGQDGKYLLYSARTGKRWDLWALPLHGGPLRKSTMPVRLTNGPISFSRGAIQSRDGKRIFAIGSIARGQLVRYDMKSHQFVPLLSGISATDATYSKDGNWVAYTAYPEHTLWRSRSDGSERMQLTYPPMEAWEPFISPDGTKIAFDSVNDNSIRIIDMNGGSPREISASAWSPRWSPDGTSLVYNRLKADGSDNGLEIAEVAAGKKSEVPSPNSKLGAFWLDQQTLVAADGELKKIMMFDFRTRAWTDLVVGSRNNWLQNWINSPDGRYVYYAAGGAEATIRRIRIVDHHIETIVNLKDFTRVANFGAPQLRVAPDGSPTLTRAIDSEEIYALTAHRP